MAYVWLPRLVTVYFSEVVPSMRTTLIALVVLLASLGYYSYSNNPAACRKLAQDLISIVRPLPAQVGPQPDKAPSTNVAPAANSLPASPPPAAVVQSSPPQTVSPVPAAPRKAWMAPAVIPEHPNWTWTMSDGTVYHDVKIVKIYADCVVILHADGGGRIPLASLSTDMQKFFNYDPEAAAQAASAYKQEEELSKQEIAREKAEDGPGGGPTTSYLSAVNEAKARGKLLLLDFTGSDWCGYCKALDGEVLSTSSFQRFSASNFVFVTVDFPHQTPLPPELKAQNDSLGRKYHVNGFPTLLVTDCDGKELGRTSGYDPGSGPKAVIAALQAFCKH